MEPKVVACPLIEPVVGPVFMNMYQTECDIREHFDTNECPNIFVSKKLHE